MEKKFLPFCSLLLCLLAFPIVTFASEFKMKDGSIIKGELREESIQVKASLGVGVVNLNPKDVTSIVGGEKVEVRLRDGSLIKGEIVGSALRLKTAFGELIIDPQLLARYDVGPAFPEAAATTKPATATSEKVKEEKQAKEEEEVGAGADVQEVKTFDLPFNTTWQGALTVLNGMGEKTDKVLRESGQISTLAREYTDVKSLSTGGFEPGQIKYEVQVFVISLSERKTKVAFNASFNRKKMMVLLEPVDFPEGLRSLRQAFYGRLNRAVTP